MPESVGIGHLLVVAGVSGAGKSTFVDQLISRNLPPELGNKLSSDTFSWINLAGNKSEQWLPIITSVIAQTRLQGVVLHHNISGSFSLKDFQDNSLQDDALISLIPHADTITIVTIRPPNTQIIDQLVQRESVGLLPEDLIHGSLLSTSTSFFKNKCILRVIKTLGSISPKLDLDLEHAKRRTGLCHKLRAYKTPGWLEQVYDRWQSQLTSVTVDAAPIEHIVIKPDVSLNDNSYGWFVVSSDKKERRNSDKRVRRIM